MCLGLSGWSPPAREPRLRIWICRGRKESPGSDLSAPNSSSATFWSSYWDSPWLGLPFYHWNMFAWCWYFLWRYEIDWLRWLAGPDWPGTWWVVTLEFRAQSPRPSSQQRPNTGGGISGELVGVDSFTSQEISGRAWTTFLTPTSPPSFWDPFSGHVMTRGRSVLVMGAGRWNATPPLYNPTSAMQCPVHRTPGIFSPRARHKHPQIFSFFTSQPATASQTDGLWNWIFERNNQECRSEEWLHNL